MGVGVGRIVAMMLGNARFQLDCVVLCSWESLGFPVMSVIRSFMH